MPASCAITHAILGFPITVSVFVRELPLQPNGRYNEKMSSWPVTITWTNHLRPKSEQGPMREKKARLGHLTADGGAALNGNPDKQ